MHKMGITFDHHIDEEGQRCCSPICARYVKSYWYASALYAGCQVELILCDNCITSVQNAEAVAAS